MASAKYSDTSPAASRSRDFELPFDLSDFTTSERLSPPGLAFFVDGGSPPSPGGLNASSLLLLLSSVLLACLSCFSSKVFAFFCRWFKKYSPLSICRSTLLGI